jgi:hypothetical protein
VATPGDRKEPEMRKVIVTEWMSLDTELVQTPIEHG